MKRAAIALALAAGAALGAARIAAADDQGGTLITVQWDAGSPDAAAPAATAPAAPAATAPATPTGAATAPATATATADAGAPAPPGASGATRYRGGIDAYYKYFGLDLDVSGGGGYFWGKQGAGVGFGRVRGGVMYATWPLVYAVGATFEANNLSPLAWGIQAEVMHIGMGLWLELGGMVDYKGEFGGSASVGWSLFGIEAQVRGYRDVLPDAAPNDYGYGFALVGKVRVPIGFILYAISRK